MKDNKYTEECLVSIVCSTYNQKKYIAQCLDSLLMQKTDFAYEIIIKDDASTDNQQEILKRYQAEHPEIIKLLLFKENYYSRGLSDEGWEIALKQCQGKYIAICEGDDFWTDDQKLQIQVDFMEDHPDYSLFGHAAYYADEDGTLNKNKVFGLSSESKTITIEDLLSSWAMATNSVLYRASCKDEKPVPYRGQCVNGDFALITYLALKGKVYYSNRIMSAYRVQSSGSLSQSFIRDQELYKEKRLEFLNMLDRLDEYTNKQYTAQINNYKESCLFDYYLTIGDREGLKKYKHKLPMKDKKQKVLFFICMYCNK